jgi:hypothetical protein
MGLRVAGINKLLKPPASPQMPASEVLELVGEWDEPYGEISRAQSTQLSRSVSSAHHLTGICSSKNNGMRTQQPNQDSNWNANRRDNHE